MFAGMMTNQFLVFDERIGPIQVCDPIQGVYPNVPERWRLSQWDLEHRDPAGFERALGVWSGCSSSRHSPSPTTAGTGSPFPTPPYLKSALSSCLSLKPVPNDHASYLWNQDIAMQFSRCPPLGGTCLRMMKPVENTLSIVLDMG